MLSRTRGDECGSCGPRMQGRQHPSGGGKCRYVDVSTTGEIVKTIQDGCPSDSKNTYSQSMSRPLPRRGNAHGQRHVILKGKRGDKVVGNLNGRSRKSCRGTQSPTGRGIHTQPSEVAEFRAKDQLSAVDTLTYSPKGGRFAYGKRKWAGRSVSEGLMCFYQLQAARIDTILQYCCLVETFSSNSKNDIMRSPTTCAFCLVIQSGW